MYQLLLQNIEKYLKILLRTFLGNNDISREQRHFSGTTTFLGNNDISREKVLR